MKLSPVDAGSGQRTCLLAPAAGGAPRPAGRLDGLHDRKSGREGCSGRAGTRIASGLRLRIIWTRPFGSNLITCVDIWSTIQTLSCAVDAHLLRLQQAVCALADLPDELAGPIELEQPRAAVRDGARGAEGDLGLPVRV